MVLILKFDIEKVTLRTIYASLMVKELLREETALLLDSLLCGSSWVWPEIMIVWE